jgi:hypothetical protein
MAHLIACLGSGKDTWEGLNSILASGLFDKIYLVTGRDVHDYVMPHLKSGVTVEMLRLEYTKPSEELVPELYAALKKHFTQDKIQDLDIAVNIMSGTGKEHAIVISTLIKLGYGIRLIELDKDGNLLEMM